MSDHRRFRALSGVRGRVVLTVLVVTACLYSVLGTVGFLYIANSGRDAIRERVGNVIDQLESGLRSGTGTVSITTPDGVEAVAIDPDATLPDTGNDVVVRREVAIGAQPLVLIGHASQARLNDSLRSLHRGLWIGVPLAVLLTATIAGLATSRALRPVSVITDMADAVGDGDVNRRVPVPDTDDEIEHLARTVNEMLDRIAAGRTAQRQFTSDAAHELRTPLMALQGEIELAMRSPGDVDAAFLRRIDSLADRLAHRVDDLVLLSTLDEQPPLRRVRVDVVDIVSAEAAAMPSGGDAPTIEIVGDPTEWSVDERLFSRAVRNLMSNACRHAAQRVRVEVGTTDGSVDGVMSIVVDDDGPGVPEQQRDFILHRFGRLDEARNSDGGGAGLGLAIVDSVVRAHGGDVEIGDSPMGGARISLRLPNEAS